MPANLQMCLKEESPKPVVVVSFSLERIAVLTPAEREVARFAAAGLSNEAIAQRRGTTLRTVANQMACILAKLRIMCRSALATIPELRV
jgi:DNA-binding NarL/FixJ family response regulator